MPPIDSPLLAPALAWSLFLRYRVENNPALGQWIADAAQAPVTDQVIVQWLHELAPALNAPEALPVADCRVALRKLRERVFCTIMVRDLAGLAPLEEVVGAMSCLADVAITQAYRSVASDLAATHGIPLEAESGLPQELLIVGMGKLGGCELNVSSDIDLVMLYGDEGETRGPRPLSHHEFYGRVTRRMMPVLSEIDAHGYVFRTDLRLRPDGDAGPPAWSLEAFENYLVRQGREWERYAWLKGRRIEATAFAGSDMRSQAAHLESLRRPFVYRKYFDFDALASLRALRERIRNDWNRRAVARSGHDPMLADNVKLGSGGIREVEFIVQVAQLVRGGRMPALQTRGLLAALAAERDAGLLPPDDAEKLEAAYRFLRRVEHALQYREDQQTQLLPRDPQDHESLAHALGFDDAAALHRTLDTHRQFVEAMFRDVFRITGMDTVTSAEAPAPDATVPQGDPESDLAQAISTLLPDAGPDVQARADAFYNSPRIRSLPETSRRRLAALMPAAVQAAARTATPSVTLARLFDLVEQIAQRSAYLALLAEYPGTLARVARMVAASEWAARYLMRHPLLLDGLIDWQSLLAPPDFEAMGRQLTADLDACVLPEGGPDTERQMDLMRDAHRQASFQILAQDLEGSLSVEKVGDYLSLLADVLLQETLNRVWPQLARTAGTAPPHFAVIAYGKLGGKELGYESDLDIVFLFDDPDPQRSEVYARYARRIVSWLNSMTSSGRLYEVDLRLRPDGDAGLLAVSVEAFARYQTQDAWPWEHQALSRARHVAGDPAIGERFEQIRREVLLAPRDPVKLAGDVRDMRVKVSAGHLNPTPLFDVKHDAGGMVDVEFVTQYLVLAHACQHPALVENLGNITLLRLAANAGLITHDIAQAAGDAYRTLRRTQHALRLQGAEKARVAADALTAERAAVRALWDAVLGTPTRPGAPKTASAAPTA